jgi:hypothetical protein
VIFVGKTLKQNDMLRVYTLLHDSFVVFFGSTIVPFVCLASLFLLVVLGARARGN